MTTITDGIKREDYKSYNQYRRAKLMAKDPHCTWCGREVVYFPIQPGQTIPGNFATIDHLYDRYNPKRKEIGNGGFREYTLVLACSDCNHWREVQRTAA